MDVTVYSYPAGDPVLIDKIVNEFLSQGKFDKLRKECMADADTKPAYQNLQLRVENIVSQFLKKQIWKPDLNKNQLRDSLRKHILESGFLDAGINRIVDQIVNPNVLATVFMPEVEEVVYSYLSIPRPGDKLQKQCDSTAKNSISKEKQQSPEESKPSENELDKDLKHKTDNEENHSNGPSEKIIVEYTSDKSYTKLTDGLSSYDQNMETRGENAIKGAEADIKREMEYIMVDQDSGFYIKEEFKPEVVQEDANDKFIPDKMELPSDDSQESLSRIGVERLRISESDGINVPDSDASIPLEINEKSMSESRDSDDSIMNKMSPISQGRLTPDNVPLVDEEKEEKEERKEKNPLTFIGRIPKIKRDDFESSKSSKKDDLSRIYMKSVYSSDESDSSKHSFSKSDSDDKRSKEKKSEASYKTEEKYDREKKYKDDEKRRKSDNHKSGDVKSRSKDGRSRDDKSRSRRDEKDKGHSRLRDDKRDKSRDKMSTGDKKSSSSSSSSHSRSKSSSHHRSVHKSGSHDKDRHRDDSRSRDKDRSRHERKDRDKRDFDKRKKEEEKRKKSKSVDDHGKERNKKDDRRSTDRDSNERERDKTKESSSSQMQSDGKKRERDGKVDETKKEKNQGEESDRKEEENEVSRTLELGGLENSEAVEFECINDGIVHGDMIVVDPEQSVVALETEVTVEVEALNVTALCSEGALTKVQFPKVIDDFYVKFNSTGFRYFEDWETTKMDCEDEFREYIDEAEKDLSLLSDDGSDYESLQDHIESESLTLNIITNSFRGLGNFERSLIFDPATYDFYMWTSQQHYRRQFGSFEVVGSERDRETNSWSPGLMEEDEIHCLSEKNKENHERDRKIRKSLKLLNRYHRKMGLKFKHGKEQHRFVRRLKKHGTDSRMKSVWNNRSEEQAKWRVLNASENVELHDAGKEVLTKSLEEPTAGTVKDGDDFDEEQEEGVGNETEDGPNAMDCAAIAPKMDVERKIRLYQIQSIRRSRSHSCTQKTSIIERLSSGSREDYAEEEENVVDPEVMTLHTFNPKKIKKRGLRIGLTRPKPSDLDRKMLHKKVNQNYNLPLSPESDDSTFSINGVVTQKKDPTKSRKRGVDAVSNSVTSDVPTKKVKDHRRTVNQKYDSQDLYKPRPFSIGSKTRGRALRVGDDFTKIEDTRK